jgi:hypothetical protein
MSVGWLFRDNSNFFFLQNDNLFYVIVRCTAGYNRTVAEVGMDEGITEGFLSRLAKEVFFFVYRLRVFIDAYSKDFVDSAF